MRGPGAPGAEPRGSKTTGEDAPRRRRGEAGSVFIETMLAAAIVAMSLAGTYRVISDNAFRERAVEARRLALLVAESEMADVGAEIPLAPGDTAGSTDSMAWRVRISPYAEDSAPNPAGDLLEVVVEVKPRAGGPALATLRTVRLGSAG